MADSPPGDNSPSALPEGSEFDGVLMAWGPARIDGRVNGPVIGTDALEIGAAAEIHGPVEAREIRVAGRVAGDVVASERVELVAGARISGRIKAPRLSAEDGARIEGRAQVGTLREPPEPPQQA